MPYILEKYFSDRSEAFRQQIVRESEAFEQQMAFLPCRSHRIYAFAEGERDTGRIGNQFRRCEAEARTPDFATRITQRSTVAPTASHAANQIPCVTN